MFLRKITHFKPCSAIIKLCILFFIITLYIMDFSSLGNTGLKGYSPNYAMFDMQFSYTSHFVYNILNIIPRQGIYHYIGLLLIDIIFIVCFAILQHLLTRWLVSKLEPTTLSNFIMTLPYLRALFDLLENLLLVTILLNMPNQLIFIVSIASLMTSIKWIILVIWLITFLFLALLYIASKIRKEN